MPRYANDPRDITVRYPCQCARCGQAIGRGATGFYYPLGKKVYGDACGCADTCRAEFYQAAAIEDRWT